MKKLSTIKPAILFFPHQKSIAVIILWTQLLLLGGCASTLDYDPAILRFDTPEATGKTFGGSVSIISGFTPNRELGRTRPDIEDGINDGESLDEFTQTDLSTGTRLDLGLLENVDIYYRNLLDTPNIVGIKLQVLGQHRKQNTNGLKMAFSAEYGIKETDTSNGSYASDAVTRTMYNYDVAVNIGYRINKNLILYNNNFYNYNYIHGFLGNHEKEGYGKIFGSLIGARVGGGNRGGFVGVEYGLSFVKWPHTGGVNAGLRERTQSLGVNLGYAW